MTKFTLWLAGVAALAGKPTDEAAMKKCFPCHQAIKDRDFVFTRYAP